MSKEIRLYPSNWWYNAGVIGLMRVFQSINNIEESFLQDDGCIKIDRNIFEKINVDKNYFSEGKVSSIVGNSPIYRNYLQENWKPSFKYFINHLKNLAQYDDDCGICGIGFYLPDNIINSCQDKENLKKFLQGIRILDVRLNYNLAPSGKFPNSFWNYNSLKVCDLCGYILIHHHIPFESAKTQSGEIFINAPSFKVMWYLNKFAEQMLSKNKSYQIQEILGMSFIEFAQKVAVTLGAWSMMNIEMIIKKSDRIDYYSLPIEITRVLLQKEIASLISSTNEPIVLDTILSGKFSQLITLSHDVVRSLITKTKAGAVSQLKNKDTFSLKRLSEILPELYSRINYITNREVIL
jgi:CRISPR-associated protein Cst1